MRTTTTNTITTRIKKKDSITMLLLVAASVMTITALMFSSLAPVQKVYAPSGGRGDFAVNFVKEVRGGACPNQSDYSLCLCDDPELLEQAAAQYYAGQQQNG